MKLAQYSFLIFIFLKQFYIFNSGAVQPGDLFLLISLLFIVVTKKKSLIISKIDYYLLVFLFFVILINFTYHFIYLKIEFIMSTLYYIFSFLLVIVFRNLLQEGNFINQLLNVLKINLITQFFILILGIGEYYCDVRYMGTFNDPNQFAFFIYITLMLSILGAKLIEKKVNIIYYLITLIMIFESGSTGMLLAMGSFLGIYTILNLFVKSHKKLYKLNFRFLKIIPFSFITIFSLIILIEYKEEIFKTINDAPILQRVEQKLNKVENENNEGLIEDRGLDKLLFYPEKMILGAGQGYYSRFDKVNHKGEIHSTLPSILFSYGIFPTMILIMWFYKNIKKIPIEIYAIFISLTLESFTLLNQRQPFFWMLFVLASEYLFKRKNR